MPTVNSVQSLQNYLEDFGYLRDDDILNAFGFNPNKAFVDALPSRGVFDERTARALRTFQTNFGLPITGELDAATLRFMDTPRCGFPDVGQFVLQGNRWTKTHLTVRFDELGVLGSKAVGAFDEALSMWSAHSILTFEMLPAGHADIVVRFVRAGHGDTFSFDGPGGVLAHAFFPPPNGGDLAGDCHFDDEEPWTLSGDSNGIDFVTVAAHEIGHAIGIAHSTERTALMYPYYNDLQRSLHEDDIAGVQALYRPLVPGDDDLPSPSPVRPTNRYISSYGRFAQPRSYVLNKEAKLWDFGKRPGKFIQIAQFQPGTIFGAVGYAKHTNGYTYVMTDWSFGNADQTGTPKFTRGVNMDNVDLRADI